MGEHNRTWQDVTGTIMTLFVFLLVFLLSLGCQSGGAQKEETPESEAPATSTEEPGISPNDPANHPEPPPLDEEVTRCYGDVSGVLWLEVSEVGAQSMSHTLVGQHWWIWDGEVHNMAEEGGIVLVAIHNKQGEARDELEAKLKPREEDRCDVRVVSVQETLSYLDERVAELHEIEDTWAHDSAERLEQLSERITKRFEVNEP